MRVILFIVILFLAAPAWAQRPSGAVIVDQVARSHPSALANSCQSHGGSWEFLDRVVDIMHADNWRWAYNAKRGNVNDPSHDAISYYFGDAATAAGAEGSEKVYIFDVIGGHCGTNPQPAWIDQTDVTWQSGTIGRYVACRPGRTNCGAYAGGGGGGGGGGTTPAPDYTAQLARIEQAIAALATQLAQQGDVLEAAKTEATRAADAGQDLQHRAEDLKNRIAALEARPFPAYTGRLAGLPVTLRPQQP